jgi:hypothetical protein
MLAGSFSHAFLLHSFNLLQLCVDFSDPWPDTRAMQPSRLLELNVHRRPGRRVWRRLDDGEARAAQQAAAVVVHEHLHHRGQQREAHTGPEAGREALLRDRVCEGVLENETSVCMCVRVGGCGMTG